MADRKIDKSSWRIAADCATQAWLSTQGYEPKDDAEEAMLIERIKQVAKTVRRWLEQSKVGPLSIEPGSPWQNGYVEWFNGKLRDELLNQELFLSLAEARYVAERWRLDYNHHRPHSSLGWMTPAAFAAS